MGTFDPSFGDEYQETLASMPGDNTVVPLTVRQAQKIVNIIAAGRRGHLSYAEATDVALDFLEAAALEALRDHDELDVTLTRSSDELWKILDELPWPIAGPPQGQPDAP